MPEQDLNGAEIRAGFIEMCRKTVTQGIVVLLMICTLRRFAIVITLFRA
jgi:hypothetical protein